MLSIAFQRHPVGNSFRAIARAGIPLLRSGLRGQSGLHSATIVHSAPTSTGLESVTIGDSIPAFQLGKNTAPAVIVLQEWWGITEEIKKQAQRLTSKGGYRTIVPDLYKGKLGLDAEEASHLMSNLDFNQAIEEIKQTAKWAKDTGSPHVGVMGFCMGGALAMCAAQHSPDVCAAVVFYGIPDRAVCQPQKITVPLDLHFGELDDMQGFSDPDSARRLAQLLSDSGVEYELHFYTGVGHAFMNSQADNPEIKAGHRTSTGFPPSVHDQQELAWSRTLSFFDMAFKLAPAMNL